MKDAAQNTRDYDWWLIAILMAICALGVRFINAKSRRPALPKIADGTQNIFAFAIS